MINTLKSDFYKLRKQKSFYICLGLSILVAVLTTILENHSMKAMYGYYGIPYDPSENGINGIGALKNGITLFNNLFLLIFMVLFTSMEFSHGTIKNQISRGRSHTKIYLSKFITVIISTLVFLVLTICGIYLTMVQIGGTGGTLTKEITISILQNTGMYLLALLSYISLFLMLTFMFRNTAISIVAILISEIIISLGCKLIDAGIKYLFNKEFHTANYWIGQFINKFPLITEDVTTNDILIKIGICLAYLVLSTVIGIFVTSRRDVK